MRTADEIQQEIEKKCRQLARCEYATNADIRRSFTSEKTYEAWLLAEARGQVRIYGMRGRS